MSNVLLDLLQWDRGFNVPRSPPGYLHPVETFNLVGRHIWEADWFGNEMRASFVQPADVPHSSVVFDGAALDFEAAAKVMPQYTAMTAALRVLLPGKFDNDEALRSTREWDAARQAMQDQSSRILLSVKRRDLIVNWLGERAATGAIGTVFRPREGGAAEPMPLSWWGLNDYVPRFWACGFDPGDVFNPRGSTHARFFFNRADTLAVLSGAPQPPAPIVEIAAEPEAVASTDVPSAPDDSTSKTAAHPPTDRTGGQGRPSVMHIMESMMRTRFGDNEFCPASMREEAEALLSIFKDKPEFDGLPPPTIKTLRNNLGPLYRRLKGPA